MIDRMYRTLAKPFFFQFDPEAVHELVLSQMGWLRPLGSVSSGYRIHDSRLKQTIWGLPFQGPVGLAGGFDKNALCIDLWDWFGFSFFEIGTVTPRPQTGNPKPRLFRYPDRQAIVNRMGFNNDGCEAIAARLDSSIKNNRRPGALMAASLGKQVDTPVDDLDRVIADYLTVLKALHTHSRFFVVNVSSPNTKNLRELQRKESLRSLLSALRAELASLGSSEKPKPLCLKLAPDLADEAIAEAVETALDCGISGFIATNTTNRTGVDESGGLSGRPLRERSTEVVRLIADITERQTPIIGCGGVFSSQDAIEKLEAGAWLLQLYTGFIYEGPGVAARIQHGLLKDMEHKGFQSVADYRAA